MEKLSYLLEHHLVLPAYGQWLIFGLIVFILLFLDLFVFHRHAEEPKLKETFWACVFYIAIAIVFGFFVIYERGTETGMLYFTGFLVEKSLSLDNIFIMSVIFSSLKIERKYQHRVLFWGILGAIVMRGVLIGVGEALISNFHWVLYIFSAFLIYTGVTRTREECIVVGDYNTLAKGIGFVRKKQTAMQCIAISELSNSGSSTPRNGFSTGSRGTAGEFRPGSIRNIIDRNPTHQRKRV